MATADRSNDYELNQLWFGVERKVDTKGCGFDVGGRIDMMYGSDWRYGDSSDWKRTSTGKTNSMASFSRSSTANSAYNDLTVLMGHYAALDRLRSGRRPRQLLLHALLCPGL